MTTPWLRIAAVLLLAGLSLAWLPWPGVQIGFCLGASLLALAWLVHCRRRDRRPAVCSAWLVLAALVAWMLLQLILIEPPDRRAAAAGAATWSAALMLGLLLISELESRQVLGAALRAAGMSAAAIGLWAFFQGLTSDGKVLWLFPPAAPVARMWGPFLYHNKLAQFAELMLPVLLCLVAVDARRRWLWLASAAGLLVVTVAAASRAGVALLAGEFLLCAVLLAARGLVSWRRAGLLALQFAAAAAAGILIAGWESLAERVNPQQMLHDRRFDLNAASLEMARAHLPWGAGYGSWPVIYPEFARFDDGRYANQAHNDWLQWACEGGIPGVALMVVFAALVAAPLLRSVWGCGVLFVLVHALVDYPFHQNAPLAVLIVGIALVAHRDNGRWLSWEASRQYAPSPVRTTFTVLARM